MRVLLFVALLSLSSYASARTFLDFENYPAGQYPNSLRSRIPIEELGKNSLGVINDIPANITKGCLACLGQGNVLAASMVTSSPFAAPVDLRFEASRVTEVSFKSMNVDYGLNFESAPIRVKYSNSFFEQFGGGTATGLFPVQHQFKAPPGHYIVSLTIGTFNRPIDNNLRFGIDDLAINGGAPPLEKVKLEIAEFRIAQRVFEPSANGGLTTDVVIRKPYSIEGTVSGTIKEQHRQLRAIAELYVDGQLKDTSQPFLLGDIADGLTKLRISPWVVVPNVFDEQSIVSSTRIVNFVETKLSLIVSEITGCSAGPSFCFSAPTQSDRDRFFGQSIPFANRVLPLSEGGLSFEMGSNRQSSILFPLYPNFTVLTDALYLWFQKKVNFKDVGVYLVSDDYFEKIGFTLNGGRKINGYAPDVSGIVMVNSKNSVALAHELIHLSGAKHSPLTMEEGIGTGVSGEIWTSGRFLYPRLNLSENTEATNIFANITPPDFSPRLNLDQLSYNSMLKYLVTKPIDPEVFLVAGIISADGRSSLRQLGSDSPK
jgi:hypothetical protein